jgi:TolA-binding protein
LEAYRKVASNQDLIQEADYMLAFIACQQGINNATELLEAYLYHYPDARHSDEAGFLIGSLYFEREAYHNALHWLENVRVDALTIEQQEALQYRLGYSLIQNDDLKNARYHLLIARELQGTHMLASTYYIAYIDYATGKYTEAMREFNRLRNDPQYSEHANYYIAQINFIEEKYDETVRLIDRILRRYPDSENNTELFRIAGNSYYQLGNQDRAVAMLNRYVSSVENPSRGEVYLLGVCEYNLGHYEKALDALSQTIAHEDELTQNASLYMGQSYLQLKDKNNARMSFDHAGALTFNKKIQEILCLI